MSSQYQIPDDDEALKNMDPFKNRGDLHNDETNGVQQQQYAEDEAQYQQDNQPMGMAADIQNDNDPYPEDDNAFENEDEDRGQNLQDGAGYDRGHAEGAYGDGEHDGQAPQVSNQQMAPAE